MLTLVLTLVLTFFFLKDGPRFLPWVARWLPERSASHVAELSHRFWGVLGGFIRAQSGVGLADAIGIGVGLAVLGVPLALPLAVLTFVGAFIPIVGAFITGLLAVLVAWVTDGTTTALIVAALVVVVQQLESNLLSPLLMGRTLALHPALVILGVTAGGTIAGVTGAFLAVPVLAVATAAARYAKELVDDRGASPPRPA
jgi:predicted PurR-regulated permease PerM